MKQTTLLVTTCHLLFSVCGLAEQAPAIAGIPAPMAGEFKNPPLRYRARPLYWLNANLDPATLREQILAMRDTSGFGGFAPLVLQSARPEYLTEGYFERYKLILETAEELGLKVIFYDDISFPTGTAGGRLAERFPGSVIKNLRKEEREVRGPRPPRARTGESRVSNRALAASGRAVKGTNGIRKESNHEN